jgi:hypothetical protein
VPTKQQRQNFEADVDPRPTATDMMLAAGA